MQTFDYSVFTTRNLGFITLEDQLKLKKSCVFIPGVGGMGGTLIVLLARMGVENFIISDMDTFEISNLNRQIFARLDTIDREKVVVAKEELLKINPNIKIEIFDSHWINCLDQILPKVDLVINGCDDIKSTIHLLRKCRDFEKTVIDAYASVLPNVYVVGPKDLRPEEYLNFPCNNLPIENITPELEKACAAKEIEHVLVHSSSGKHVVLEYAAEMISGKRKRISFAPMVWGTSVLMAFEANKIILGKKTKVTPLGVFVNPWDLSYEKPLHPLLAFIKRIFVRKFLKNLSRS